MRSAAGDAGDGERLADQLADGEVGVEGAQRVLEGQLHLPGAAGTSRSSRPFSAPRSAPSKSMRPAGRADQSHRGAGQRGLARPGLADDAEDLPRQDVEVDVGQGGTGARGSRSGAVART